MLALPFVTFDWTLAWWTHLSARRGSLTDELRLFVFRDSARQLLGVAPMMVTRRVNAGPLSIKQLQFLGADVNITELRCIAAPVEHLERIHDELVQHLSRAREFDWIKFTGLSGAGPRQRVQSQFGKIQWEREVPNFILPLKPTWEEFKSGLSRNIKESLRKCYNAPKRDGLAFEFQTVTDPAQIDAAVSEFLRLHALRAQLADTVVHPNVFRDESAQHFLRDVCQRFSAQRRLHVFQLRHDNRIIATRIGLACGDSLYLYYSGYDPDYAKYSVMTTTVAEAIQYAIAQGFQSINLSVGRDVSKERWKPEEVPYCEVEVLSPGLLSSFKYSLFKLASSGLKDSWLGKLVARNA